MYGFSEFDGLGDCIYVTKCERAAKKILTEILSSVPEKKSSSGPFHSMLDGLSQGFLVDFSYTEAHKP